VALTQTQLASALAERVEMSKADAKIVLDGLEEIILEEIGNAEKVQIGKLVQLTVKLKPASKARPGRNPATGEAITIKAKPYSASTSKRGPSKPPRTHSPQCRRRAASSPLDAPRKDLAADNRYHLRLRRDSSAGRAFD
jgi:nucleoid DNA-binding protein